MPTFAITSVRLREALHFDPIVGVFRYAANRGNRKVGDIAGSTASANGYVYICVDRVQYLAHRLAWLWVHGTFPTDDIDHIDGNRTNNAISNLRAIDRIGNNQNRRSAGSNNLTGLLGVSTNPSTRRFRSKIMVARKAVHLGYFDTPAEAHAAYVAAKRQLHPAGTL